MIGRLLQRLGAVFIKYSVYVLPRNEETYEDFQWIARDIVEGKSEAIIVEARFVDGLSTSTSRMQSSTAPRPPGSTETRLAQGGQLFANLYEYFRSKGLVRAPRSDSQGGGAKGCSRRCGKGGAMMDVTRREAVGMAAATAAGIDVREGGNGHDK